MIENIRLVVFDMDGVITSERQYWNAASLSLAETLYSHEALDLPGSAFSHAKSLESFLQAAADSMPDRWIAMLKERSVNTNWDVTYTVIVLHLVELMEQIDQESRLKWQMQVQGLSAPAALLKLRGFLHAKSADLHVGKTHLLCENFLKAYPRETGFDLLEQLAEWLRVRTGVVWQEMGRSGGLWKLCHTLFQRWYHGHERKGIGRVQGLIERERPLLPIENVEAVLSQIELRGIVMGIATGRTYDELVPLLQNWGLINFFDSYRIITDREVVQAEHELARMGITAHLAKPHAFSYLKAIHPSHTTLDIWNRRMSFSDHTGVLIVGDTPADVRAGKTTNCRTCAVLSGIQGEAARSTFETLGADSIIADIRGLPDVLGLS